MTSTATNSHQWPLLLENFDRMNVKDMHYTPLHSGHSPHARPIKEYVKYGLVNIDKTKGPSSHEIVTWVKNILMDDFEISKTGHCGTLDPQVSGCLTILIERATRLSKIGQAEGKEYVCTIEFGNENSLSDDQKDKQPSHHIRFEPGQKFHRDAEQKYNIDRKKLEVVLEKLSGQIFQRPPKMCAVKRNLRLRNIYKIDLLEILGNNAILRVKCEAGTYIRTLCTHIGLLMGHPAFMKDLRRTKSGVVAENILHTMHDLLDSVKFYNSLNYINEFSDRMIHSEAYLRKVVLPLESILTQLKRIVIKDTAINAICYGGQLTIKGILRYDDGIEQGSIVVLVSTKGEAVAIANSFLTTSEIASLDHGIVCKTKRVIMERDLYPRSWKMGQNSDQVIEVIEKHDQSESSDSDSEA